MKTIMVAALALGCSLSATAESLFRCEVVKVQELKTNGKIGSSDYTNLIEGIDEVIIFDSESGLFRFQGETGSWNFDVLQQGSSSNAMKAVRIKQGSASAVMETFRIDTYSNSQFMYVSQTMIRTGLCETL